jgi:hypothetical protein
LGGRNVSKFYKRDAGRKAQGRAAKKTGMTNFVIPVDKKRSISGKSGFAKRLSSKIAA